MKITEIQVEFIKPNNGLIAFASLVIDDSIYLSSMAVYKKLNGDGYRVLYPKKGIFDVFHPINKKASDAIEEAIFSRLEDVMSEGYDNRYNSNENTIR